MAKLPLLAAGLCLLAQFLPPAQAAAPGVSPWVAQFNSHYHVEPDVVYRTVGERALTVDLYLRSHPQGNQPVVLYIHGGAWVHGNKSWELGYMLPWMDLGWDVVSVEYRMTKEAKAPAGVDDCFWAYHWLLQHAAEYHFDLNRVIVSGASAGGNLALLVGMAPESAGFDHGAPGPLRPPAAIVSIAGVTDVAEMLAGPHYQAFAGKWLGGDDQVALGQRVSPLTYVHAGLPPIFLVHGDADKTVPYEQATRMHAALDQAGVPNQLLTIPHGGHGGWTPEDYVKIYATLAEFLAQHHL